MQGSQTSLTLYLQQPGSTIYTMIAKLVHKTALLASVSTIYAVDYDLMHRRMGHLLRFLFAFAIVNMSFSFCLHMLFLCVDAYF